jgi:acetolactate synthase-1/2/3 large subunit
MRPSGTGGAQKGAIAIHDLINALQEALPEETAITLDVGVFKLVFLQQWHAKKPYCLFVANGLSAMGYAIPGALGIRLAQPERPIIAIVGDGALLMYAGELATVARLEKPLLILVVADQALSLIRLKQLRQQLPVYGTEFNSTSFPSLADAFNIEYRLVDNANDAQAILTEALQLPGPVLVEARISKDDYDQFR